MGQEEEVSPGLRHLQSEGSSFHTSQILPAPIQPSWQKNWHVVHINSL